MRAPLDRRRKSTSNGRRPPWAKWNATGSSTPGEFLRFLPLAVLAGVTLTKTAGKRGRLLAVTLCLGFFPAAAPAAWLAPSITPYKGLPQAFLRFGAQVVVERSGPLGHLVAVESPIIPWRYALGLSITAPVGSPAQVAIFLCAAGGGSFFASRLLARLPAERLRGAWCSGW